MKNKGIIKECNGLQELFDLMKSHAGHGYYINHDLSCDKERLLVEGKNHNFFLWCVRRNGTHLFNMEIREQRQCELIPVLKEDKDNRFFEITKLGGNWYLVPHQVDLSQNDCQKCYFWLDNNPDRKCYDCRDRNNFTLCTCCIQCENDYTTIQPYNQYICESCDWENFERLADYLTEGECEFSYQYTDYKIVYENGEYHLYSKQSDYSEYYYVDVTEMTAIEIKEIVEAFDSEYPAALNYFKMINSY